MTVTEPDFLTPPEMERFQSTRNFLDTVVCEFRFPALLQLESEVPVEFADSLRERFPLYQPQQTTTITPAGPTAPTANYKFTKRKERTQVGLTSSSLSLATNEYQDFEKFLGEIEFLIERVLPLLKTSFFTRLGLRYVNKIQTSNTYDGLAGTVNGQLSGLITAGVLGAVGKYRTSIEGRIDEESGYHFQYGLDSIPDGSSLPRDSTAVLDFDYYVNDVDADNYKDTLSQFHKIHFPFFWWTLGEKSRAFLQNNKVS
jgi:uncharacterized protein (TIGR04255 family)